MYTPAPTIARMRASIAGFDNSIIRYTVDTVLLAVVERDRGADSMRVIVVGAGLGGIAAAIELTKHGFDDVKVLESAASLGGTWFHNSYPGAACDVPSHLYSYSFAQRRHWSRICSPQQEIL